MPRVMPPFVPTAEQRHTVSVLASMLSWDKIRLVIINKRTKKPISKETLQKAFAGELEEGVAILEAKAVKVLHDQLDAGNLLAAQWVFKNRMGYRDTASVQVGANADGNTLPAVTVHFVVPDGSNDRPLINGHNGHANGHGANGHV